jgi:hypothetical protein
MKYTLEEIAEYNQMIADFMGFKPIQWEDGGKTHLSQYRVSWDALMPVLEEIGRLPIVRHYIIRKGYMYICVFDERDCHEPHINFVKDFGPESVEKISSIEATYFAIAEFLKWYKEYIAWKNKS